MINRIILKSDLVFKSRGIFFVFRSAYAVNNERKNVRFEKFIRQLLMREGKF